ncbi:hypothetical protein DENSPDRAFT_834615, partial [Dentipellis sp. KUC8613]
MPDLRSRSVAASISPRHQYTRQSGMEEDVHSASILGPHDTVAARLLRKRIRGSCHSAKRRKDRAPRASRDFWRLSFTGLELVVFSTERPGQPQGPSRRIPATLHLPEARLAGRESLLRTVGAQSSEGVVGCLRPAKLNTFQSARFGISRALKIAAPRCSCTPGGAARLQYVACAAICDGPGCRSPTSFYCGCEKCQLKHVASTHPSSTSSPSPLTASPNSGSVSEGQGKQFLA